MWTFTAPIAVPNLTKLHLVSFAPDTDNLLATLAVLVQGAGGIFYNDGLPYLLVIRDGLAQGIRQTAAPLGFGDRVEVFTTTAGTGIATIFSDCVAAFTTGGGGLAARTKAVEVVMAAAGLFPPGVGS